MSTNHYKNLLAQAEKIRRHNRQGSYQTRIRYFEAYKRFLRYVAETYRLEKISNLSGKHLSSYIGYMQEFELSASTIKTDIAAIRFFHDKISDAKYSLPSNNAFELERRSFGKVDRTWSDAEFNRMLEVCITEKREDYAACIAVARYAGLRLHEVMRIDTSIARNALKNDYITIKGKNGLIRNVPTNHPIHVVFEKFLKVIPNGQKLFVSKDKQTHIAMKELQNFIGTQRASVQDSDSTRPLIFHGLRHSYAAETYQKLIANGKSEYEARKQVSLWLGHRRDEVTRIYLAGIIDETGSEADV